MLQEKSITKAEDLVLIRDDINTFGPIKPFLKSYVIKEYRDITMLKWEALQLVAKANEYAIKAELRHRKQFNELPLNIQYDAKEKFFKDHLENMDDDKADVLTKLLSIMIGEKIN